MLKKLFILFFLILTTAYCRLFLVKSFTPVDIFKSAVVQDQIKRKSAMTRWRFWIWRGAAGFANDLLTLFQNKELRPSGGFIGAYAIVRLDKGDGINKVEGTEVLIKHPLTGSRSRQSYWRNIWKLTLVFRDANWSPDFSESAKRLNYIKAKAALWLKK